MQLDDDGFEIEAETGSDPTSDRQSMEERARAQGWRPKDEWTGDPDKWRDADEFLRVGNERAPILRRNLEATERRLRDLERETADKLARVERMSEVAIERERARIAREYDARVRYAIANQDPDEYEAAAQAYHQEAQDLQQRVATPARPQRPDLPQEVSEWAAQNAWFQTDPVLQMEAQAIHMDLQRRHPHMPLAENLRRVTATIQQRYPDAFGLERERDSEPPTRDAPRPPTMAGGVRLSAGKRSYAERLPADVRAIAERFVARGTFKSVEEYAKDYFEGA